MWKPIVLDEFRIEKSIEIINHVYAGIGNERYSSEYVNDLMYGELGNAIFSGYMHQMTRKNEYAESAFSRIEHVIERCEQSTSKSLNFGNGLMGIIWGIEHLMKIGVIEGEVNDVADSSAFEAFFEFANIEIDKGNYDYLLGGLGILLLAPPFTQEDKKKKISKILRLLDSKSQIDSNPKHRFWFESPILANNDLSSSVVNMGLSHGLPSIIAILTKVYNERIESQLVKDLIESCSYWIIDKKSKNKESFYPYSFDPNKEFSPSDLRWCYGDLGIATSLFLAGISLRDNYLTDSAIEIALRCAKRSYELRTYESHLCHGSSGVSHIFNRFYNYTDNPDFQAAGVFCLDQTLKNFDSNLRTGYRAWQGFSDRTWGESDGFLEGSAGIGLVLISAISDIEPKWDSCLLLS